MVYGNSDMDMLVAIPCPSPISITDASLPVDGVRQARPARRS